MASAEMTKLVSERFRLFRQLLRYSAFIRGSMVELKRPCIYKKCKKCKSGKKHPTVYYSISRKNKTTLIYLPRDIQPIVKKLIDNYHKVISIIDQMSEVSIKMVKLRIKQRRKK